MNAKADSVANPGPSWGYRTIAFWEAVLPAFLFRMVLSMGTFIGLCCMPQQRQHSANYWKALKGKPPSWLELYRHFHSFMVNLVLKLQTDRGLYPNFDFAEEAHKQEFIQLCSADSPALFGTFHVGYSDMMGCMLRQFDQRVAMVRHRVGNSRDTEVMANRFADNLRFIWINDPLAFIFDLKNAIQNGESVAIQCDRTDFGSKTEGFTFLGKHREFPFTIYFLSDLFKCPVVFAFTGPREKSGRIEVHTSRVYHPGPDRQANLKEGRRHFQEVLTDLESHLNQYPDLWFNFRPLNKEIPTGGRADVQ